MIDTAWWKVEAYLTEKQAWHGAGGLLEFNIAVHTLMTLLNGHLVFTSFPPLKLWRIMNKKTNQIIFASQILVIMNKYMAAEKA